jgi:hypothetical protein
MKEALHLSKPYNYSSAVKASRPTINERLNGMFLGTSNKARRGLCTSGRAKTPDYFPIEALELSEHSVLYGLFT